MPLTGDFRGFDQLEKHLASLAQVPAQASREVAKELTTLLQQEFKQGTDPYGKRWAPLKPSTLKSGRHPPPLTATGALRDGTKATPMVGAGVQIEVGEPYGVFHQYGTYKMAARPILPSGVMPKAWTAIVKAAVGKLIKKALT